jgi:hypothetical protein
MPSTVLPQAAPGSAEDLFSVVEALRRKAVLVMDTIEKVMLLPGASFVRVGELKVSLTDVRSAVDDLLRSQIEPLAGQVAGAPGVDRLIRYQFQHATIVQNVATATLKSLQDTLRAYDSRTSPSPAGQSGSSVSQGDRSNNGLAPQVSESFIDRLVDLSKRASDEKYRQDLTDKILLEGKRVAEVERETEYVKGLLSATRQTSALSEDARTARVRLIEKQLSDSVRDLEAAYEELSGRNLAASTALFSVTSPVVTFTERAFGRREVLLYGASVVVVTLLVLGVGCTLHAYTSGAFNSEPRAV